MTVQIRAVPVPAIVPVLARLYGSSADDLSGLVSALKVAWLATGPGGEEVGAATLRPTPAHGFEVIGGAWTGEHQVEAAVALLRAALEREAKLYAFADAAYLPTLALEKAGFEPFRAYTRHVGPLPDLPCPTPNGVTLVPIALARQPHDLVTAHDCYSDRIGHTSVPAEVAEPRFGGSDDQLGRLAYDASGHPIGICRAWLEDSQLSLGAPGVNPAWRESGLRRALLLASCVAGRHAGATTLVLDAWGDDEAEREEDAALGLQIDQFIPIYRSREQP